MNFKNKYSWLLLLLCLSSITFIACDKEEKDLPSNRQTIVKILGGSPTLKVNGIEAAPNLQDFFIDLRRDPNDEAGLNTPLSVKVTLNNALITTNNSANGTSFVPFPSSGYTLSENLANDITFQPGEFAKPIKLQINISALDLTKQYALGVSITSVGSGAVMSTVKDWVQGFIVKNQYDGIYAYKAGRVYGADRPLNWDAYFVYSDPIHLITTGPNTVKMFNTAFGAGFIPLYVGGALSGLGGTEPNFEFNPTTNAMVNITNPAADARNRQFAVIPGSPSRFIPSTKMVIAHMIFSQAGQLNSSFYDTLVFVKKR